MLALALIAGVVTVAVAVAQLAENNQYKKQDIEVLLFSSFHQPSQMVAHEFRWSFTGQVGFLCQLSPCHTQLSLCSLSPKLDAACRDCHYDWSFLIHFVLHRHFSDDWLG